MTLPQAAVELFPEGGSFTAVDTRSNEEYELSFNPPRQVSGLGELYRANRLAVNDELQVKALEGGRFAVTPVARPRAPDYTTPEAVASLLDDMIEASSRLSVQEMRAVFKVPDEVDLEQALREDGRFTLHEGRWVDATKVVALTADQVGSPTERGEDVTSALVYADEPAEDEDDLVAVAAPREQADQELEAAPLTARQAADVIGRTEAGGADDLGVQALHAGVVGSAPQTSPDPGAMPEQAGLWPRVQVSAPVSTGQVPETAHGRETMPGPAATHGRAGSVVERRATHTPYPFPEAEDDEAPPELTELASRFRRVMAPLGFQIEPIGKGQVRLAAAMGRRAYQVLVQLLSKSERLDWAELLSKRRAGDYRHLAVVGDHHDLLRLTGPAELARATLWSWQGLDRLATLHQTVPLSPMDLEPHFERDGLFEHGLQRFEATIAERVAERGALSEVLARLNQLRAPAVFLLEDLVSDLNMPRDRTLEILERLTVAPFHLIARVDHGEFVLRQRVDEALAGLASYATSLKERLPSRQVEKLTGLGEPELLVEHDDGVHDEVRSDEVGSEDQFDTEPTSEGGISA